MDQTRSFFKWTQKSQQLLSLTIKQNKLKVCRADVVGFTQLVCSSRRDWCVFKDFGDLVQEQVWGCTGEQISLEKLLSPETSQRIETCGKFFNLWSTSERTCDFLDQAAEQKIKSSSVQMDEICYKISARKRWDLVFGKMSFCDLKAGFVMWSFRFLYVFCALCQSVLGVSLAAPLCCLWIWSYLWNLPESLS